MNFKKIFYFVCPILLVFCFVLILICHRLYVKEQWLLADYTTEKLPQIVCYGDSLTFGTGGVEDDGTTYPGVLEELLEQNHLNIPVINYGIGGDNTVTIAGRTGGIPFRVNAFTIPEQTEPVEITFLPSDGQTLRIDHSLEYGGAGLNDCTILGVKGRITLCKDNDISHYFFTRNETGAEITVPSGTQVTAAAASENKDAIFIIWMGENLGYSDNENLIDQYNAILSLQDKHAGEFIVIGLTSGTASERADLENAMNTAFGEKYINLREILSTEGLAMAGIPPTSEDETQTSLGCVPPSLLYDGIHFNSDGYRVIGQIVYERLLSLGYLDELIDKTDLHIHWWK